MGKVSSPASLARTLSLQRANARAKSSRATECSADPKSTSHELSKRYDALFSGMSSGSDSGWSYISTTTTTITTTSHSPTSKLHSVPPSAGLDRGDESAAIKRSLSADICSCSYKACFSALSERIDRGADLWDREFSSMSSYRSDLDGMFMSGLQRNVHDGTTLYKHGEDSCRKSWSSSSEEDIIRVADDAVPESGDESGVAAGQRLPDNPDTHCVQGGDNNEGEGNMGLMSSSSDGGIEQESGAALPPNSVAVEKVSVNLVEDFRQSMYEMMMEKDLEAEEGEDMQDLLDCYLLLNPAELHDVIREVFSHVWIDLIMALR